MSRFTFVFLFPSPTPSRLVSYELLNENPAEPLRVIISSQALYFFRDSPPDPQSLSERIDLNDLQECRASSSKTSKWGDEEVKLEVHSLSPAIPSFYIVMSLVEPPNTTSDGRRSNTKVKCSKEEKAIKVNILFPLSVSNLLYR